MDITSFLQGMPNAQDQRRATSLAKLHAIDYSRPLDVDVRRSPHT